MNSIMMFLGVASGMLIGGCAAVTPNASLDDSLKIMQTDFKVVQADYNLRRSENKLQLVVPYKTTNGEGGRLLWIVSGAKQRIDFHPLDQFMFAIEFLGKNPTARVETPKTLTALKGLAHLYYVFPQLQAEARSRGFVLRLKQGPGRSRSDCTPAEQDSAMQQFSECAAECGRPSISPGNLAGFHCAQGILEGTIRGGCSDCCGEIFPGCEPPSGGGGGFGFSCLQEDPYCNALKAYYGFD